MNSTQDVIYRLMMYGVPVLLSILAFIGGLAVNALIKMGRDIGDIKITISEIATKHDGLEQRVSRVEKIVFEEN